jgi:hypothetical protein
LRDSPSNFGTLEEEAVVENEEEGCFASKVAFSLDVTFDSREGEEERSRERVRKRARERESESEREREL